ncbi:hypothetical protein KSP40_PGU018617 [Platanthera guangdongensis]|uniref:Uncharacterized protein n=1 Tax=Platanthera guangdongensis TaxID=2320717 RepID=A0ABR2LNQ0_9ASPA
MTGEAKSSDGRGKCVENFTDHCFPDGKVSEEDLLAFKTCRLNQRNLLHQLELEKQGTPGAVQVARRLLLLSHATFGAKAMLPACAPVPAKPRPKYPPETGAENNCTHPTCRR